HFCPEQTQGLDVRMLAPNVFGPHVDDALEPEARAHGRRRDAVLPCAGLGDDAPLPEPRRQQDLTERVVDLVRSGVVEVLALENDAAPRRGKPMRLVERRRTADVVRPQSCELLAERRVRTGLVPAALEFIERGDQRLRDVAPAVGTVRRRRHRAASTYARTRWVSLMRGGSSRLDLASTAPGRTASIASRTFSGPRPPASMTRPAVPRARSRGVLTSSCPGTLNSPAS